MRWKRRIRVDREGLNVDADVNLVISTNAQRSGGVSRVTAYSGGEPEDPDERSDADQPPENEGEERSSNGR